MRLDVLLIAAFVTLAPAYRLSSDTTLTPAATAQSSYRGSSEATEGASSECFSLSCGMTIPGDERS